MKGTPVISGISIFLLLVSVVACGNAGSNSGSGGTTPPPSTKEFLYAANTFNSIFALSIDSSTGSLAQTGAVSPGGLTASNTAIAITPSGKFLYAANDVTSGINCYSAGSSGTLTLTAGSPFLVQPASQVIHGLATDPGGKFLYAASQSGMGIVGFTIDSTSGELTIIPGGPFQSGDSNDPLQIAIDPTGRFLYATTAFDDGFLAPGHNLWGFTIDSQTGALNAMAGSPFATEGNAQPNGLEIDPSGKFLYVALSNAGSVAGFTIDSTSGGLTPVPSSPFATGSTQFTQTYYLAIAPSGKFLYAFNFNGSSLAAFGIESGSGVLTSIAGSPFPANPLGQGQLVVDPSGKYLYLAIGSSLANSFDIFDIDANSGALTPNSLSPFSGQQEPTTLLTVNFQ